MTEMTVTDTAAGLYRRQQPQEQPRRTGGGDFEPWLAGYDHVPPPQRNESLFSPRRRREFTPDHRKDRTYWDRRHRNNEAARRSREKRRLYDIGLERKVVELSKENYVLKVQLIAIKHKFGVSGDDAINAQQVMALLPSNEEMLRSIAKRPRTSLPTSPDDVDSASTPASGPPSDAAETNRGGPPPEQHRRQQQRQQWPREEDSCPADAARARHCTPVPLPPPPTSADGALNLARGPPPCDGPANGVIGDHCTVAAAGQSPPLPPVIWRAFATAAGLGGSEAAADCCRLRRGRSPSPPPPRFFVDGPVVDYGPVRCGADERADPGDGLPWAAAGPAVVEPTSWLMMAAAAAAAAAACAGRP